jgi:hypothetical protein
MLWRNISQTANLQHHSLRTNSTETPWSKLDLGVLLFLEAIFYLLIFYKQKEGKILHVPDSSQELSIPRPSTWNTRNGGLSF